MSDSDSPQPKPGQQPPTPDSTRSRRAVWAAVATLCIAAGVVGSLLAAHSVAHNDATKARLAFNQSSAGIASTLKLAVAHEEDLATGAGTFFAANPHASRAQFDAWAGWVHPLGHYPELERLGLVAVVRRPTKSRATPAGKAKPTAASSAPPPANGSHARAVGVSYRCLALAGLARGIPSYPSAGLNYCTQIPQLLASRDSGRRIYALTSSGRTTALVSETPVYRGGSRPSTPAARRGAFVGWLHEVLAPGIVMRAALRGHPGTSARLRYRTGASTALFTSGSPRHGAPNATIALANGWTATVFGAPISAGVLSDGPALALLIAGILLSTLLGVLVLVLGTRRPAAKATAASPAEALYDRLTGLPNEALTLDLATRIVARAGRQSGLLAGALLIDIDWFKDVNDKLGEAAGDQLLRIVVERLEGVVRTGDTLGRLGGDKFVVLLEAKASGLRLDSLARRLIESLHDPVELDGFGPSFMVTASIGVAYGRYTEPAELLGDAESALQAAKTAGKDRFALFNANMRSVTEGEEALEVELNAALAEQQFFLVYQPIYDLETQKVLGLEALIRWLHPQQGVLLPADFLPLAEETGMIVPIGRWVLEEACSRAAAWNVAGNPVGISVTVSAKQLNRDGFAIDVRRALQQSGIQPSLLTLEIAETAVMADTAAVTKRLEELKLLGVKLAIDDFGNGYAYRSNLQQMPLDYLKVDRSSLAASEDEDYRSWLLEAILHFGRDISLTVIAKGVETQEEMTALRGMGCTMAQGLFLGEPLAAEAVEVSLAAESPTASHLAPSS
jgi:diguanylate cyclase (GGDEF)-like protein